MTYSMRTGGAFDMTIKPVLDLYGFGGGTHRVPRGTELQLALSHVGISGLRAVAAGIRKTDASIEVAVGGVAKGYAIDRAVQVLREHGIESAIVNAGGDLYCLGTNAERPWQVGIRDPGDPDGVVAIVEISDAAVATSGDYERFFESDGVRYHHIINPRTGLPARHLRSATVVAPSAEEADAFATAVFVLGADRGLATADRERLHALVVDTAGVISATPSFPGQLE
jgi:thiamine biosynthesis lipoprotein